jgi:transcriptional regulator with XRE-family HTH domain
MIATNPPPQPPKPWVELQTIVKKDGHWNLRSLGKAAGMSHESVRQLLRGDRKPTADAISKLANALQVPKSMLEPREHTEVSEAEASKRLVEAIDLLDRGTDAGDAA